jgi:O-antigen/teichoic acid export membrane protein
MFSQERKDHDKSFFRQSGWLMVSTVVGGSLMWAVHFLAKAIPEREYGDFGAFLAVVMLLPAIPLQMLFAQQTAKSIAEGKPGQTSRLIRSAILLTVVIWAIAAIPVVIFHKAILAQWKVSSPAGLWLTIPVVLLSMIVPMFWGVLQGAQNFFWLGWSLMLNSFGRVVMAAFAVLAIGIYAPGMLLGVLFGLVVTLSVAVYHSREHWSAKPLPFEWRAFASQAVPLLVGFGAFQTLFTLDTMFVKAYFPQEQAGFYVSAGTLSRALLWLVLPLASVMFPRLVHSAVKAEKTNLMTLVMIGTAVLAAGGALGLALVGSHVVRVVYKASYVDVASSLLPWYGAAMVPLALGNVLLNQLMAKPARRLALSLSILGLALGYMLALSQFHDSLLTVLKVMGSANTAFLLLCAFFAWRDGKQKTEG